MHIKLLTVDAISENGIMGNSHFLSCIISVMFKLLKISIITFIIKQMMTKIKKRDGGGWL